MYSTRFSATFSLPSEDEFILTRVSKRDYGYTVAWIVIDQQTAIVGKGFSRNRWCAEKAARTYERWGEGRTALYAPVAKADMVFENDLRPKRRHSNTRASAEPR
jgi:hypothetical protein